MKQLFDSLMEFFCIVLCVFTSHLQMCEQLQGECCTAEGLWLPSCSLELYWLALAEMSF